MSHLAAALATVYTEQHVTAKVRTNYLTSKVIFHKFGQLMLKFNGKLKLSITNCTFLLL